MAVITHSFQAACVHVVDRMNQNSARAVMAVGEAVEAAEGVGGGMWLLIRGMIRK